MADALSPMPRPPGRRSAVSILRTCPRPARNTRSTICARERSPLGPVAAVCIWPQFVGRARALRGTPVHRHRREFPAGGEDVDRVIDDLTEALGDGAQEIDLVLPYEAVRRGDLAAATAMVAAVRDVVDQDRLLKVILGDRRARRTAPHGTASRIAIDAGADFIKTSTGKTAVSATPEAAEIMLNAIKQSGRPVGLKPSGGIRTVEDAGLYLDLAERVMGRGWATPRTFRIGASSLYDALVAAIEGRTGAAAPGPTDMLLPQEFIRHKRDGGVLEPEHIDEFHPGPHDRPGLRGTKLASFAMAVCATGLSLAERVALTRAMTRSGEVLTWDAPVQSWTSIPRGSRRSVSLALAPAVAACGGFVPMISGRGLGHTGGTLDKLDSIPGYVSQPDIETFRRVTREVGCAIIGQTADRAGRQASLRHPGRHRDGGIHRPHHGVGSVEEARGRARPRHGREIRLGRLHVEPR